MAKSGRWHIWIGAGLLLMVPLLGLMLRSGAFLAWDYQISELLVLRGDSSIGIWAQFLQLISWLGRFWPRLFITILLAMILYRHRGGVISIAFFTVPIFSSAYSSVLKALLDRPRPDIIPHLDQVSNAAFPSGHVTGAMVVYGLFFLLMPPKWRIPAGILAAFMIIFTAISRLALGVHWATDIIGGSILALGVILITKQCVDQRFMR